MVVMVVENILHLPPYLGSDSPKQSPQLPLPSQYRHTSLIVAKILNHTHIYIFAYKYILTAPLSKKTKSLIALLLCVDYIHTVDTWREHRERREGWWV